MVTRARRVWPSLDVTLLVEPEDATQDCNSRRARPFNASMKSAPQKIRLEKARQVRYPSRRQAQAGVGIRIRAMRQTHGWSQHEFARRCQIDSRLLGEIERGHKNFSLAILLPIAKALETTVAELIVGIA